MCAYCSDRKMFRSENLARMFYTWEPLNMRSVALSLLNPTLKLFCDIWRNTVRNIKKHACVTRREISVGRRTTRPRVSPTGGMVSRTPTMATKIVSISVIRLRSPPASGTTILATKTFRMYADPFEPLEVHTASRARELMTAARHYRH